MGLIFSFFFFCILWITDVSTTCFVYLFIQPSLLVQTEGDDDVIKEERESVGDSDSSSSSINGMMRRGEHHHSHHHHHHHRQVELGSSGMGEVSEHSGVHVSYLEELHFRERSELARQMAALALASQVERELKWRLTC
jgi:hypothetical protein